MVQNSVNIRLFQFFANNLYNRKLRTSIQTFMLKSISCSLEVLLLICSVERLIIYNVQITLCNYFGPRTYKIGKQGKNCASGKLCIILLFDKIFLSRIDHPLCINLDVGCFNTKRLGDRRNAMYLSLQCYPLHGKEAKYKRSKVYHYLFPVLLHKHRYNNT